MNTKERLLVEYQLAGDTNWYGRNDKVLGDRLRAEAEHHLATTPERYYYPPEFKGRIRISFSETIC